MITIQYQTFHRVYNLRGEEVGRVNLDTTIHQKSFDNRVLYLEWMQAVEALPGVGIEESFFHDDHNYE